MVLGLFDEMRVTMLDQEFADAVREARERDARGEANDDDRRLIKLADQRDQEDPAWAGNSTDRSDSAAPPSDAPSAPAPRRGARSAASGSKPGRRAAATARPGTTSGRATAADLAQSEPGSGDSAS